MVPENDDRTVPPEEREIEVLDFLASHGIALPPKALYRGLKTERNITFSYRTVQNILARLNDSGEVMRCDKEALDRGEFHPIDESEDNKRTYYFITDSGRNRLDKTN